MSETYYTKPLQVTVLVRDAKGAVLWRDRSVTLRPGEETVVAGFKVAYPQKGVQVEVSDG